MKTGRRSFLAIFALTMAGAKMSWAERQRQGPSSNFPQIPDASKQGMPKQDDEPPPAAPNPRGQLMDSQKNLRRDADHLLRLAKELKDEADKTEQTDVLSLSLVHKAEEVEKLARQIKDLVRAA